MLRNRRCRNQKFRREYPIPPYIVDLCCVSLKLIIEVDGEHHQTDEGRQHDQRRDQFLAEQGYDVVRIPGYEVVWNAAAVRRRVEQAIDDRLSRGRREPERNERDHTECGNGDFFETAVASTERSSVSHLAASVATPKRRTGERRVRENVGLTALD